MLGGNGALAVLVFSLALSNHKGLPLISDLDLERLLADVKAFQGQIAFLLESLFFFSLGVVLVVMPETILYDVGLGALFTAILLCTRYLAVYLATYGTSVSNYRLPLTVMCAQGIVPVTLSVILLDYPVPLKEVFLSSVTYIVIFTNLVTTLGVGVLSRLGRIEPS